MCVRRSVSVEADLREESPREGRCELAALEGIVVSLEVGTRQNG